MSEPFLGQIILVPYNFAPRGWAFCSGQILPISQNTALFSLLGTTYGGNGQTTFALPDLRGRVAVSAGQGPGLSDYSLGEVDGVENVALTTNQMPMHNHGLNATLSDPSTQKPSSAYLANGNAYSASGPDTVMGPQAVALTGGSQPHENRPPLLCLNYCIALEGIFPSRN
jgi:microcystin-dependent protein